MEKAYTAHIRLIARGHSEDSAQFIKLEIRDLRGTRRAALVRIDDLHMRQRDEFTRLNQVGANLITSVAQGELLKRLQSEDVPKQDLTVAKRLGWVSGAYVLPDEVIGARRRNLEIYLGDLDEACLAKFQAAGNLEGARRIAELARGNSRLMLALSVALVGPLGGICRLQQVGIQLFGKPGSAKTALAAVASSVWGWNPDPNIGDELGFGDTWNHTLANLERVAPAHQHGFMVLDETRVAHRRGAPLVEAIVGAVMKLGTGVSTGRLVGSPRQSWCMSVLSTSNLSLDELGAEARFPIDDAYRDRLIDVPAPEGGYGFVEELHGFADLVSFVEHLKRLASENHGVLIRRYLAELVGRHQADPTKLTAWIETRRSHYLKFAREIRSPGRNLERVHQKFATLYAAARLAIRFGLFPWTSRELRGALLACERAHVRHVAAQQTSGQDPALLLRTYIEENHEKFVDVRSVPTRNFQYDPTELGYFALDKEGRAEFLLSAERFERIFGGNWAAQRAKAALFQHGLIKTTGAPNGRRFALKRLLGFSPDGSEVRPYVLVVRQAVLGYGKEGA